MRQGQNSKRSRGRGSSNHSGGGVSGGGVGGGGGGHNRRGGPGRMHTFDSNGPSVRIRGNASQVHEKYLALARDANSAGDRVAAESYLQYAEHYFRIINADNDGEGRSHQQQGGFSRDGFSPADDFEEEDDGLASGQRPQQQHQHQHQPHMRGDGGRRHRDARPNGADGGPLRSQSDPSAQPQPVDLSPRPMPAIQPTPAARQPVPVAQPAPKPAVAAPRSDEFEPELGLPAAYTAAVVPQEEPAPAPRRRGRPPGKARAPSAAKPDGDATPNEE